MPMDRPPYPIRWQQRPPRPEPQQQPGEMAVEQSELVLDVVINGQEEVAIGGCLEASEHPMECWDVGQIVGAVARVPGDDVVVHAAEVRADGPLLVEGDPDVGVVGVRGPLETGLALV
jgi:hypothetical protein